MYKKVIYSTFFSFMFCLILTTSSSAADPSLVGWWKLDETSGLIAADSSGSGNDGTLMNMGGEEWTTGVMNGALEMDGTNDYVDLGNNPSMQISGDLTIALWIKMAPENDGAYLGIAGKMNDATDSGYAIVRHESNYFRLWTADSGTFVGVNSNSTYTDTDWHHLAGVRRNGTSYLYVDGIEQAERSSAEMTESGEFAFIGRQYHDYDDRFFNGTVDDVRIYNRALSEGEIQKAMRGEVNISSNPNPENEAVDVPRDVILSWTPGEYPGTHTIYLGTDYNDVNDGIANVLLSERQDANFYDIGRLEFGMMYYWRVDEVNDSADASVYTGSIWNFTIEPYSLKIPSANITASASSQEADDLGPDKTIDESGLDPNNADLHSTASEDMWLTDDANATEPAWIQYDFDKLYKLHQMLVWNYNGQFVLTGFGIQDVNIEYSEDGQTWTQLSSATQFERAPGAEGYKYNTTVDFNGLVVKSIRINALTKWGGDIYPQYGLSEVRFMYIPVRAREPDPDIDEEDVPIDVTLSWRAGREAQQHIVSLSTDQQAISDGSAVVDTIDETSYSPLSLDIASVYYWRIDEFNDTATPTTWIGDTWSFRTQDYIIVDDFESYDDQEPNRIWDAWSDGWEDDNNGSTIGHPDPDFDEDEHFVETEIIHGGGQSAPIIYDNTSAAYSEVSVNTSDLPIGRADWTVGSPEAFVLWFYGDPNNEPTDKLYVKLGDIKKDYLGDVADIARTAWTKFEVPLAGINISNISSLKIGIERVGATGGDGTLFVDDIQLTFIVTATDPGTDNLIAKYDMENNLVDSSGGGFDGTFNGGDPNYVTGKYGMALALDGEDDYVALPIGSTISTLESCTISSWINWAGGGIWQRVFDFGRGTTDNMFLTPRSGATSMRFAIKAGNGAESQATASSRPSTGNWEHLACVIDATNMTMTLYLNGNLVATNTNLRYLPKDMGVTNQNWLGRSQYGADPYFSGMLDDFRIYNKALSDGEIKYIFEN